MRLRSILFVVHFFLTTALIAQTVQTPDAFLGYPLGSRFTLHYKIVQYVEALAKARPDMVKLEYYGKSYEGRPLLVAFISNPDHIANLENIRINNLRLARQSGDQQSGILNTPAIVWMSYNVHGNEASSSEAVLKTLHALLDPMNTQTKEWLKNTVIAIDPCINPDGRDRYANWYHSVASVLPDVNPAAREHVEPWPGARTNHYNFDLNRDWAWQSQIESQQRIALYNKWLPQIHVDFHEQGYNEPYYFAPAAEPYHEVITPWQRTFQSTIGKNHAKYFDAKGWLYFTKERFDLFYPSYGDTYPTYNGAIGMTYEQGGIRAGLAIINEDGDTLTLKDRLEHHYTTGLSTIEIASKNADKLINEFKKFFDDAVTNGAGLYKSYLIRHDASRPDVMDGIKKFLAKNGIRFEYAITGKPFKAYNYYSGKEELISSAANDLVISSYQPRAAFARVLLEPRSKITDTVTYDITAWSIPYAWGVEAFATTEKLPVASQAIMNQQVVANLPSAMGYVIPWNSSSSAKLLAALLKSGIKVRVAEHSFNVNGKSFEKGSLIVLNTSNQRFGSQLPNLIQQAVESVGFLANVTPVNTGFVDEGYDFGSSSVRSISAPRVAMLTGEGVSALAAGTIWHYFEQELKYPLTLIDVSSASRIRWNDYNVIIMPDGNYKFLNDKQAQESLKSWISQGGRLIALEDAAVQITKFDWGFALKKTDEKSEKDSYTNLKRYEQSERDALTSAIPGAVYKVDLDNSHPLGFGFPGHFFALKRDAVLFEFIQDGWNVGVIKRDNYVTGFVGHHTKAIMNDGLILGARQMGTGQLIMMNIDPIFRNFWESGKLLLSNAVFIVQ